MALFQKIGLISKGFRNSFSGLGYAWQHKNIRKWCILPSLIHIGLTIAFIFVVYRYDLTSHFSNFQLSDPDFQSTWLKWIGSALGFINWIILFFVRLIIYACAVILAFALSMIITSFILEKISIEVECLETGTCLENPDGFLKSTGNEIKVLLKNLSIYLASLILTQLLHFLPLVGSLLAVFIHALFSGWFVSSELLSATLPRHYPKSADRAKYLKRLRATWIPFGWGASLLLFIPGSLPWLTAASAKYFFELNKTNAVQTTATNERNVSTQESPT